MYVARFDVCQILVQHLCHRTTCHVCALWCHTACIQISACMLRVTHIYVRDYIHDTTVCLLWQTLVETTIACLHMEDRDMQTLSTNHRQARVCVAQHQHSVWFNLHHQFVRRVDDIPHRCTQVIAYSIEIHLWVFQFQVFEKHAIKVIVIVLTCMRQDAIEIFTTFIYHCRQAYNLRACANNDEQLQFAIITKFHFTIIYFHIFLF